MRDVDIGARLKAFREAQDLSQRQLAQVAGVTGSMISMIEQNRTSPSVATLKKILSGLKISLGAFFEETPADGVKWHFTRSELGEINPEIKRGAPPEAAKAISFLQVGGAGTSALQMLYEHYPPGADTGPDLYSHEAEEAGIVIDGQIEITVGSETRLLNTGDAYLFNSRLAHRFRNPGDIPCTIVSACTPPTF